MLSGFARGGIQVLLRSFDFGQHAGQRALRHLWIVAQRLKRLFVALELLQQVRSQIGARRDFKDFEESQQRRVVAV